MKKIVIAILIVAYLDLAGCISTQTVSPEYLTYDKSKSLRIETNEGSSIRLAAGNYKIIGNADSLKIIGRGIRIDRSNGNNELPFNGIIRANEIRQIETVEPSGIVYSIPIYIGVVTAIGLIILISMGGRGVGG